MTKTGARRRAQLGNFEAERDWGFAGDYVEASHLARSPIG
jgi:GDP-D-mannose dehydratase